MDLTNLQIVDTNTVKQSVFYQVFDNMSNQSQTQTLTTKFLDSLLLKETLFYSKNDTNYYTIPYKHSTTNEFTNLYIEETANSFAPFRLKYTKALNPVTQENELTIQLLPFSESQFYSNGSYPSSSIQIVCNTRYILIEVPCISNRVRNQYCLNCITTGGNSSCYKRVPVQQCDIINSNPTPGGGGNGGDGVSDPDNEPTTTPNNPTHPGGEFDCIAGYDCIGDPFEDQQEYNLCSSQGGTDCWSYCELANCPPEDEARYELFQTYELSNNEISIIGDRAIEVLSYLNTNSSDLNVEDLYVEENTPDDNYEYQGSTEMVPDILTLENGDEVSISFGTTTDGENAKKEVADHLVNGLKFALNKANNSFSNSEKINSIYISATTNGLHSSTSNHYSGTAMDISRINGIKMIVSGTSNQIIKLQESLDDFEFMRKFRPVL